jgi:hypothetical protein
MMAVIMVGMQNSLLVSELSTTGWNSRAYLRDTNPQSIAFDPANRGHVDIDYLKEKLNQMCIAYD